MPDVSSNGSNAGNDQELFREVDTAEDSSMLPPPSEVYSISV